MQGSKMGRDFHTRGSKAMVAILYSHSRATGSLSRAMGSPSMAMGSLHAAAMGLPQVDAPPHVRRQLNPMSMHNFLRPLCCRLREVLRHRCLIFCMTAAMTDRVTTTFLGGHMPSLLSGFLAASTDRSCSLCAALTIQQTLCNWTSPVCPTFTIDGLCCVSWCRLCPGYPGAGYSPNAPSGQPYSAPQQGESLLICQRLYG